MGGIRDFKASIEGEFIVIESNQDFLSIVRESVRRYGKIAVTFVKANGKDVTFFLAGIGVVVISLEVMKWTTIIGMLTAVGAYTVGNIVAYVSGVNLLTSILRK